MDALEGVTVLDVTSHIAGPYATKVLADLGARVLKIERPGGDPSRAMGPFLGDVPGTDRSATYQFLNTNKESIILGLATRAGRNAVLRLAGMCDLVVSSLSPRQSEQLGLEYEAFQAVKDVPVVRVTNFGPDGPYRDYQLSETVLFAMGGEMYSHGLADREPLKLGGTAALLQCGAMAAIAALGGIHAYELHGIGQRIDVPLFEVQINSIDRRSSCILAYRWSGRVQERAPGTSTGIAGGIYPCADGFVEVTASFGNYWNRFVEMIGGPVLMEPRWSDPMAAANPANKEEVDGIVYPWMLSRTRQEVWAAAQRAHALVAPLFTGVEIANDPVFRERGLWTEIEHETLGRLPILGRPYVLERTPWRLRRPAPMLGADTKRVLAEAGLSEGEIAEVTA